MELSDPAAGTCWGNGVLVIFPTLTFSWGQGRKSAVETEIICVWLPQEKWPFLNELCNSWERGELN